MSALDWNAKIEADMAYLDAQAQGFTQAACVEAAIVAYLDALAAKGKPQ